MRGRGGRGIGEDRKRDIAMSEPLPEIKAESVVERCKRRSQQEAASRVTLDDFVAGAEKFGKGVNQFGCALLSIVFWSILLMICLTILYALL